jgi:hypothetical protein
MGGRIKRRILFKKKDFSNLFLCAAERSCDFFLAL